jgi:hypothetical protein
MFRPRIALGIAAALQTAALVHGQCQTTSPPIEVQPTQVVEVAPAKASPTEELLPLPMRAVEAEPPAEAPTVASPVSPPTRGQPEPAVVAPAPVSVEATPASVSTTAPTPLTGVNIIFDDGEQGKPCFHLSNWDREPWPPPPPRLPPRPGRHWTRDLQAVGLIGDDRPTEAFPTQRGGWAPTKAVGELPSGPSFEFGPSWQFGVGETKPLVPGSVFGSPPRIEPFSETARVVIRGFDDDDIFAPTSREVRLLTPLSLGGRCLALGTNGRSAPGVAYRWVSSDLRFDPMGRSAVVLFRQMREDSHDVLVLVADVDFDSATPPRSEGDRACLEFDPTDGSCRLVNVVAEQIEDSESPLGLKRLKPSRAGDLVVERPADHWLTRFLIERQLPTENATSTEESQIFDLGDFRRQLSEWTQFRDW